MQKPKLFIFDANSFCYRAFFAIKVNLSTSYGQPTGAVLGFLNILNKILKENKPEYLSICFDVSRNTFRKEIFADYKIQRRPMPDELISQIAVIKEIISAYNFCVFEKEGFEADDLIATIAKKMQDDFEVFVVSADKDMLQLVNDNIRVYNPYQSEPLIDKKAVLGRFGVEPEKVVEIISLAGDAIDNIPGVKGIGEKTALALIKKYGSVDNLLASLKDVMPLRIKGLIEKDKEQLVLSRKLAVLNTQVPIALDREKLKVGNPDYNSLYRIFKRLEFRSLLKDLPIEAKEDNPESCLINLQTALEFNGLIKRIKDETAAVFLLDLAEGLQVRKVYLYCGQKSYCLDGSLCLELKEILSDEKIKKIGHNFKQAAIALRKINIKLSGLSFDVMLAAYILNPAQVSYAPADLCLEYFDEKIKDTSLVSAIAKLKNLFEKRLQEREQIRLFYEIEMPLSQVLADMEFSGVKIDSSVLVSLSNELHVRLVNLENEIYKIAAKEFNINSPKQLRLILFERLKLPVVKKTKTGPSTDEEVLTKLAKVHNLPVLILEYRQLAKLKSTYIDALPQLVDKGDGKLHTSFNQTGTQTGRLSSSNPNLQNIPVKNDAARRIRLAFIPEDTEGFLLSCDYSQIELKILAHLSNDKNLISAFCEHKDVHRYTASLIFNVSEDIVSQEMRDTAKRVNFGIVYGMSSFGLSKDLDISVEEAGRFIAEYFLRYPQVKAYIDRTIAAAKKDGFVATLFGRRRYLKEINSANAQLRSFAERQAINAPIQGTASDMIKLAMVNIHNELKKKSLNSKMILQVHDELIFDVKREELESLRELVVRNMENVLTLSVPIKVEAKSGKNWYSMENFTV